jgi:hypothetical protein
LSGLAWHILKPAPATRYRIEVRQPVPAKAPRETGPAPRDRMNNL